MVSTYFYLGIIPVRETVGEKFSLQLQLEKLCNDSISKNQKSEKIEKSSYYIFVFLLPNISKTSYLYALCHYIMIKGYDIITIFGAPGVKKKIPLNSLNFTPNFKSRISKCASCVGIQHPGAQFFSIKISFRSN